MLNMLFLNKFFTMVCLAVVHASCSMAFVTPVSSSKHATHGPVRRFEQGIKIEPFHPASSYKTFGTGIDHPLSRTDNPSIDDSTISFIAAQLKVNASAVKFRNSFSGDIVHYAYVNQVHDGIPFINAVANVAFNHDNKVVAFGSSFVQPKNISPSTPTVSLDAAINAAQKALNGEFNNHPATLGYLANADGSVVLTHVMQIENKASGTWVQAYVDAHSGELVSMTDFVNNAAYVAVPVQYELPTQGFATITNPSDMLASPSGWHSTGGTNTTDTSGNNVVTYQGSQTATTKQSSAGPVFNYPWSSTTAPSTAANINTARVNTFYIVNTMHDIAYRYGFTETAFNFQNSNFGKGGTGNDRVTVSVQDAAGFNNADFATPPDGQSGRMRMFLWTYTSPQRDGALENDIVVHEFTHGITNRMTGGGTGLCLTTTEAEGLGEGWSDAMAVWTEQTTSAVPDHVMGQWVLNSALGIRTYPYSTSAKVNPLKYSSVATRDEVHNIGEVWANMLYNVYAALVHAHGFSTTAKTNPSGTEGNIVFMHLFIDALPLQPCNPTFLSARDAWIQADVNRYAGANLCTLWSAFASRGLGVAANGFHDDFTVPNKC